MPKLWRNVSVSTKFSSFLPFPSFSSSNFEWYKKKVTLNCSVAFSFASFYVTGEVRKYVCPNFSAVVVKTKQSYALYFAQKPFLPATESKHFSFSKTKCTTISFYKHKLVFLKHDSESCSITGEIQILCPQQKVRSLVLEIGSDKRTHAEKRVLFWFLVQCSAFPWCNF